MCLINKSSSGLAAAVVAVTAVVLLLVLHFTFTTTFCRIPSFLAEQSAWHEQQQKREEATRNVTFAIKAAL